MSYEYEYRYEHNIEARSLASPSPTRGKSAAAAAAAAAAPPPPSQSELEFEPQRHSPNSMAHTRSISTSSAHDSRMDAIFKGHNRTPLPSLRRQQSDMNDSATSSSQQTIPQSIANSQESNYTSSSDQAIASPRSDHSSATDPATRPGDSAVRTEPYHGRPDKTNHLLHLSTIAAAQGRISLDSTARNRKRKSDGEIRDLAGGTSTVAPVRGHARNMSTISVASTTGSTIGELSAELKTRLSYAMVKVNLGLQTRSIEEVECLTSQALSVPNPGTDTGSSAVHRRQSSSISPDMAVNAASIHPDLARDAILERQKSDPPPMNAFANKSSLAPPAPIQPSLSTPSPRLHPRRNSTPRHAALLHSQSASPHTPAYSVPLSAHQSLSQRSCVTDPILFSSQTRNAREQDAVETLLFMSSPNNSTNMKHAFSPSASPNLSLSQVSSAKTATTRHTFPGVPRKGLPSHRPALTQKKIEKASGMLHPLGSPMDLDSPQHSYHNPNRVTPRRRARGNSAHVRSALSLPVALGGGHSGARRALRDEDIERMLDRVAAETGDSSDDEEIQIPRLRNGVAGVMGIRG